jgi:hypothetical protein
MHAAVGHRPISADASTPLRWHARTRNSHVVKNTKERQILQRSEEEEEEEGGSKAVKRRSGGGGGVVGDVRPDFRLSVDPGSEA